MTLRKVLLFSFVLFFFVSGKAQLTDSASKRTDAGNLSEIRTANIFPAKEHFPAKSFLIPGIMIAYGFTALRSKGLKNIDEELMEEIWTEHPHISKRIDTYLQFVPVVSVYTLNALGIHGKNNVRDRSMIYLLSNIILSSTVLSIKRISHQLRPDHSDYLSFPSGHAAEAFASAEFMRQEYKDVSPGYGAAGYLIAAATGYLRMYNNKHWLSNVIGGAGIGIAATKLAYWLYLKFRRTLFKGKPPTR